MLIIKIGFLILLCIVGGYISISYVDSAELMVVLFSAFISILLSFFSMSLSNRIKFSGGIVFPLFLFLTFGFHAVILYEIIMAIARGFQNQSFFVQLKQFGLSIIAIFIFGTVHFLFGGKVGSLYFEDTMTIVTTVFVYCLVKGSVYALLYFDDWSKIKLVPYLLKFREASLICLFFSFLNLRLAFQYINHGFIPFVIEVLLYLLIYLIAFYVFFRYKQLRKSYLTSIESLTFLMEYKLSLRKGHSRSVGKIARKIAQQLQLPKYEVNEIHTAALLHDIGKIAMDEKFIHKKEAMKLEEIENYEKHVLYGEKVVRDITRSDKVASYVRHHHEYWNGKGFPNQLKGEEIPLGARIISAANEIDYIMQKNLSIGGYTEFSQMAYNKLDPQIVRLALDIDLFEMLKHELSNEEENEEKENRVIESTKMEDIIENSKVFDSYSIDKIVYYDGVLKDINDVVIELPEQQKMIKHAKAAITKQKVIRCFIESSYDQQIYDLYCIPKGSSAILVFLNVNDLIQIEQKQDDMTHSIYSDVMYAVTQKKLLLLDRDEIKSYFQSRLLFKCSIQTSIDIPKCRKLIEELCGSLQVSNKVKFNLLLCTSEMTTNVLKHANDGVMEVYTDGDLLRIIVRDKGKGIEISDLPKSTLLAGYSSKASLGHGFSLVLKLVDKLILSTSSKGTTIVLQQKIEGLQNITDGPKENQLNEVTYETK